MARESPHFLALEVFPYPGLRAPFSVPARKVWPSRVAGGRTYLTFADRAPGRFFLLVLFDLGFCVFFFFFRSTFLPSELCPPQAKGAL